MFGRRHTVRTLHVQVLPPDDVGDMPFTLPQACTDLLDALSDLAARHSVLDAELPADTDDAVAAAVDAVWFARRTCDHLAAAILKANAETTAEASARSQALRAYLALPDADELMRSLIFESIPVEANAPDPVPAFGSRRFPQIFAWRSWLKVGRGSDASQPG